MVGDLGLVCNVLAADLVGSQAERTALSCASGALSPADRTDSCCAVIAGRIAESSALLLVFVADQRSASSTAVSAFSTRDANICHASWAVWRADAAADIMETIMAFGVPEVAPLFAAWTALMYLTGTSSVGIRLVTVGTIVTELFTCGAVLPADWANTRETIFAVIEAEGTILFLASWTV